MSLYTAAAGTSSLGNLYVLITADSTSLVQGMNHAVLAVTRGSQAINGSLASATGAVTAFTAAVTGMAAGLAIAATKEFIRFDDAIVKSMAIMGRGAREMRKELEDNARQIANDSSTSAVDLARTYEQLASAGFDAKQSLNALNVVEKFSIAGQVDLRKATNYLVDALTVLDLKMEDPIQNMENMQRLSDLLVKANMSATGTTEQFAQALTNKAGAAFRAFGVEAEEGIAILMAFAERGIKGVDAGEQVSIALRDIQRAFLGQREEFERLNIQVFDSQGNLRKFNEILGDIENAMAGMSAETKRATFTTLGFQDRSLNSILAILGSSKAIREYRDEMKSAGGATKVVAEDRLSSLHEQLNITKNRFDNLLTIIGEKGLAPALKEINQILQTMIDISGPVVKAIDKISAAMSPLVKLIIQAELKKDSWLLSLFSGSVAGRIANKLTDGAVKDIDNTLSTMVASYNKAAKGVGDATDKIEKKTIDSFHRVKSEVEDINKDIETNSQHMNKLLDKLGAPKLEDFTGTIRRDQGGFAVGMSRSAMGQLVNRGLGSFGNGDIEQALSLNLEMEQNRTRLDELKKISEKEVELNADTQKRKMQALELYNRQARALQMAQAQFVLGTSAKIFDDLSTIAEAFGGKTSGLYKAMFAASKAFAIAESIVKIQQGIANAASLPWPANLAAIASVVAATASIVSTIQSVKLEFGGGKATGGGVGPGRMYMVGERGPEMFVPKEPGTIVPNDRLGGNMKVIVNNHVGAEVEVTESREGDERRMEIMLRRIKKDLAGDANDGKGDFVRSLERNYGLRRGMTQR